MMGWFGLAMKDLTTCKAPRPRTTGMESTLNVERNRKASFSGETCECR